MDRNYYTPDYEFGYAAGTLLVRHMRHVKQVFKHCADSLTAFTALHPHAVRKLGASALLTGDLGTQSIALSANGFFQTLREGAPDWHRALTSYVADPLPVVASLGFMAGSVALGKGWHTAYYVTMAVSDAVLGANLLTSTHCHPLSAAACFASAAGGAVGVFREPLMEAFRHSRNPIVRNTLGTAKRTADLIIGVATIPTFVAATVERVFPLAAVDLLWGTGSLASALLPEGKRITDGAPETKTKPDIWTCTPRPVAYEPASRFPQEEIPGLPAFIPFMNSVTEVASPGVALQ